MTLYDYIMSYPYLTIIGILLIIIFSMAIFNS